MTRPTRRAAGLLCLSILALTASGCVSLPDGSSINSGNGAGVNNPVVPIKISPPGPRPGESRGAIIAGFLSAMMAYPSDPALVRQFLSPTAAASWHPDARLQIYEEPTITPSHGELRFGARILGTVDRRGSWTSTPSSLPPLNLPVSLAKVDEQWRIDNPPLGSLVASSYFANYYRQFSMYFFDPTYSLLAPDLIYQQIGYLSATATSLVGDLLLGPTRQMAGVVQSAAPATAHLTRRVTFPSPGVANVAMTSDVGTLSESARRSLAAQIAWTLRQVGKGIKEFRLVVNGQGLRVQGFPSADLPTAGFEGYNPLGSATGSTLFAVSDSGRLFAVSTQGEATRVDGPISSTPIRARVVAVNPGADFAALVNKAGTKVVAGKLTGALADNPLSVLLEGGTNWLRPSIDASGLVWDVDLVDGRATLYVAAGTKHRIVQAPGITGKEVRAIAVSRDGMRLAAVVANGHTTKLVVAMIHRSARSDDSEALTDVALRASRTIANTDFALQDLRGLSWVDPTTVLVLAQVGSSQPQPYQISVDGSQVEPTLGSLPGDVHPVALAAGVGAPTVIAARGGDLFILLPNQQWSPLAQSSVPLYAPVYPG